jgi:hypothetical protein
MPDATSGSIGVNRIKLSLLTKVISTSLLIPTPFEAFSRLQWPQNHYPKLLFV